MNIWESIKQQISGKISTEAFENWLSKATFVRTDGDRLWVSVPDSHTRDWIQQEYAAEIWSAVRELNLPLRDILYEIDVAPALNDPRIALAEKPDALFAPSITLNPKFTFDTFVEGSCNQFARAAAQAVVKNPSRAYNPLFIYGGVGLGKTHLMHAIGRSLVDHYASMRIIYTSSERFMNEMITCIKNDRMQLFHRHYRSADALLIDDIQILAGKERTMEEFFHTFNDLFEHQKQIVISSDTPPKSTPGLVERLRSRFEWGLMVDVQPPDLETKMAILDKKAEAEGIVLPEEVRIFIATKTKQNVRELEGGLNKLVAYASVTGTPINLAMAHQVLKHLTGTGERRISIESIVKVVAEKFNLQPSQLKLKTNEQKIAYPRQIAIYLAKELTPASLPEIGKAFNGKHHTTVLHSIRKIDKLRQISPDLNNLINSLIDSIH
jgi:chromosomal replication initiator protein